MSSSKAHLVSGSSSCPGMTSTDFSNSRDDVNTHSRCVEYARGDTETSRLDERAQRDPQVRARGRPGARRTRGLVRACIEKKNAHEHTGLAEAVRPSLRNGFRLIRALPGDRLSCPHRQRFLTRQLDASSEASGPRDFIVRKGLLRRRFRAQNLRVHRSLPQRP